MLKYQETVHPYHGNWIMDSILAILIVTCSLLILFALFNFKKRRRIWFSMFLGCIFVLFMLGSIEGAYKSKTEAVYQARTVVENVSGVDGNNRQSVTFKAENGQGKTFTFDAKEVTMLNEGDKVKLSATYSSINPQIIDGGKTKLSLKLVDVKVNQYNDNPRITVDRDK